MWLILMRKLFFGPKNFCFCKFPPNCSKLKKKLVQLNVAQFVEKTLLDRKEIDDFLKTISKQEKMLVQLAYFDEKNNFFDVKCFNFFQFLQKCFKTLEKLSFSHMAHFDEKILIKEIILVNPQKYFKTPEKIKLAI